MNNESWVNRTEELLKLNKTQELVDSWTQFELCNKLEHNDNLILEKYNHSKLLAFLYQGAGIKLYETSLESSKILLSKSYDLWKKIWYSERADNDIEWLKQLFHLSSTGIIIDSFAEVRMILAEVNLYKLHDKTRNLEWPQYLQYNIYILLLVLIRKANGWEDINFARGIIKEIERIQEIKEEKYLNSIEKSKDVYPKICLLGAMLNILEAIDIYLNYALTGKPENIDKKIIGLCRDSYDLIKISNYEEEKFTILLIEKCILQLIKMSLWNNIYGISDKLDRYVELLVGENKSKPIFELWPSQQQAISKNFFDTNKTSIVVQMPTSAGKTLLAKFYILQTLNLYNDAKVVYLVPTRALVNQVKKDLRSDFKNFKNIIVDVAIPFADIDPIENELLLQETNILVTTPEKMDILVRAKHPLLKSLRLVIVDEAHSLQEGSRGSNLEFLLSILRKENRNLRILMLSPFINNADEIAKWLGGNRGHEIYVDWKPAQQFTGIYQLEKQPNKRYIGSVEYIPTALNTSYSKPFKIKINDSNNKNITKKEKAVLVSNVYKRQGGVLILCTQKPYAEDICKTIMENREKLDNQNLNGLKPLLELIEYEMGKDCLIYKSIEKGVAYHHSALPLNIREEIEEAFSNKMLNPVVATTTLAQGMNFPVSTVIFHGMSIYDGGKSRNMTDAEFWNIAGRAGRALTDKEGHVIIIGDNIKDRKQFEEYLKRKNQDVLSSLLEALKVIPEDQFSLYWLRQSKQFCSLLKYIYHIVLIGQSNEIDDILRGSLVYHQLSEKGDIKYAEKLVNITRNYLKRIDKDNKNYMESIDKTGLNDISMKYLLKVLRKNPDIKLAADKIFNYNDDSLVEIIKIINEIPEMDLKFGNNGKFSPELVAQITKDWVNGKSIKEISDNNINFISDENQRIRECGGYIYSTLINNLPWGIAAMLSAKGIESKEQDIFKEEDVLIPSYIYFGVKTKEAAALAMMGVPRFAAESLGLAWKNEVKNNNESIKNISKWINSLSKEEWIKHFDRNNLNKAKLAYEIWIKQNSK